MSELHVGDRVIGRGRRTFVIAEIGVNHDGSVDRALELVSLAADCGADAVKLQVFRAETLLHASARFAEYQKDRSNASSPLEMLRQYELCTNEIARIVDHSRHLGLVPLATPFSLQDVENIQALGLPAIKIASPDLVNRPLLARAAQLRRPMLISTGASTMEEVAGTVAWMREWRAPFALLHCVSSYPVPAADANLGWITELAARFDHIPIGYSDHTTDLQCGALAVAFGASLVERHLTYDRTAVGPDHSASSDPGEFADYVKRIRETETLRGDGAKQVLPIEQDVRRVSRQSLVLTRGVAAGQFVQLSDLTVQRPGTGVPASDVDRIVGRRARVSIAAGEMLRWDMLLPVA